MQVLVEGLQYLYLLLLIIGGAHLELEVRLEDRLRSN